MSPLICNAQGRCGAIATPQQRLYATESALAVKEPDWDSLSSLITSDEAKRELAGLRSQFGELRSKLASQTHVRHLQVRLSSLGWLTVMCGQEPVPGTCFSGLTVLSWDMQAPKEVKWDDYKEVDPPILDTFKKAFASATC